MYAIYKQTLTLCVLQYIKKYTNWPFNNMEIVATAGLQLNCVACIFC